MYKEIFDFIVTVLKGGLVYCFVFALAVLFIIALVYILDKIVSLMETKPKGKQIKDKISRVWNKTFKIVCILFVVIAMISMFYEVGLSI